jgi:hypothetical protein
MDTDKRRKRRLIFGKASKYFSAVSPSEIIHRYLRLSGALWADSSLANEKEQKCRS